MSQGCLEWKPRGEEGAELDVEHWGRAGSCIPNTWGKNRLPEETQTGSAVTGVFTAPPLLVALREPVREATPLPARAAVAWGEFGAGHPCPGTQPSPRSCPQGGTAQQDMQGTQLSPNPEPSMVQSSKQDLALTGTKPQQLVCPTAPRLIQPAHGRDTGTTAATKGHSSSAAREGEGSLLWERGEGAA